MKKIWIVMIMVLAAGLVFAAEPDFIKILEEADFMGNFDAGDFSSLMTIVSVDPDEGTSVLKVNQFRRDAQDKFLMLMQAPEDQKGQGYLRVDDNMWIYDPVSRKFNHFSMKESFEGTDARYSDLGRSTLADDYAVSGYTEGKLGRYEVYVVELEAKHDEVSFPYQKIWLRKDNNLILKVESYSLTKRLLRTALFPSYTQVGEKFIASKMLFTDELVEGKKTQITVSDISIDTLPDTVFTKSYVERVNR